MEEEYIVAPALKLKEFPEIIILEIYHKCFYMESQMVELDLSLEPSDYYFGFISNKGKFLNREEAYKIAQNSGQLKKETPYLPELYSDNVIYSKKGYFCEAYKYARVIFLGICHENIENLLKERSFDIEKCEKGFAFFQDNRLTFNTEKLP